MVAACHPLLVLPVTRLFPRPGSVVITRHDGLFCYCCCCEPPSPLPSTTSSYPRPFFPRKPLLCRTLSSLAITSCETLIRRRARVNRVKRERDNAVGRKVCNKSRRFHEFCAVILLIGSTWNSISNDCHCRCEVYYASKFI